MTFTPDANRIRPCAGSCGRTTRPKNVPKKDFPEAAVRINADYCLPCWNKIKEEGISDEQRAANAAKKEAADQRKLQEAQLARESYERERRERIAARARRSRVAQLVNR